MPNPPPSPTSQSPHHSTPASSAPPDDDDDDVFLSSSPTIPSDIPRLRTTHATSGYRDGITASKASTLQAGFDEGYPLGAGFGLRVGWVLGVLEGLYIALGRGRTGVGERVEGKGERERVGAMLKAAREELSVERVFGGEWWRGDGSWGYEVLGEAGGEGEGNGEGKEEGTGVEEVTGKGWGTGEVTFKEVVEGHPVVREWVGRVRREMERWGIREDGGFGGVEWEAGRLEGEGG